LPEERETTAVCPLQAVPGRKEAAVEADTVGRANATKETNLRKVMRAIFLLAKTNDAKQMGSRDGNKKERKKEISQLRASHFLNGAHDHPWPHLCRPAQYSARLILILFKPRWILRKFSLDAAGETTASYNHQPAFQP
jgi:hypothetical protein